MSIDGMTGRGGQGLGRLPAAADRGQSPARAILWLLAALLAGCAAPRYICLPRITQDGTRVLLCVPATTTPATTPTPDPMGGRPGT